MYLWQAVALVGLDPLSSAGRFAVLIATLSCWSAFDVVWIGGAIRSRGEGFGARGARIWAVAALLALVEAFAPFWKALTISSLPLRLAGLPVLGVGTVVAIWSRLTLGAMWSSVPEVRSARTLCTTGPYRYVRHPIYAGVLGMVLGTSLVAGFGPWILVSAAFTAMVAARIPKEETVLAEAFGARFDRYADTVPRLLPRMTATARRLNRRPDR